MHQRTHRGKIEAAQLLLPHVTVEEALCARHDVGEDGYGGVVSRWLLINLLPRTIVHQGLYLLYGLVTLQPGASAREFDQILNLRVTRAVVRSHGWHGGRSI